MIKKLFSIALFGIYLSPCYLHAVEPCSQLKVLNKDEACRAPRRPDNAPPGVKCQNEKSILLDVLPENNEITGRRNAWGMWMCLGPDISMCSGIQGKSLGAGEICCAVKKTKPSLQCAGENKLVAIDESQSKGKFCFGKKAWYCTNKSLQKPTAGLNTPDFCPPTGTSPQSEVEKLKENTNAALQEIDSNNGEKVYDLSSRDNFKNLSPVYTDLNLLCSTLGSETYVDDGSLKTDVLLNNSTSSALKPDPKNPAFTKISNVGGKTRITSIKCRSSLVDKSVEKAVLELWKFEKTGPLDTPEIVRLGKKYGFRDSHPLMNEFLSFSEGKQYGGKSWDFLLRRNRITLEEAQRFKKNFTTLKKMLESLYVDQNPEKNKKHINSYGKSFKVIKNKNFRKQMISYQNQLIKSNQPIIDSLYQVLLKDLERLGVKKGKLDEIADNEKTKFNKILEHYNEIYGEGFGSSYQSTRKGEGRDQRHSSYIRKILVELQDYNRDLEANERGIMSRHVELVLQDISRRTGDIKSVLER